MRGIFLGLLLGLLVLVGGIGAYRFWGGDLRPVTVESWPGRWQSAQGEVRIERNGDRLRVVGPELNRFGDFVAVSGEGHRLWQEVNPAQESGVPRSLLWKAGESAPRLRLESPGAGWLDLKLEKVP